MRRRRFQHLHVELSLAVDRAVPRYALWTRLQELGADPEKLSRDAALEFCDRGLNGFLHEHGLRLSERREKALRRRIARFDDRYPAPEEFFARL